MPSGTRNNPNGVQEDQGTQDNNANPLQEVIDDKLKKIGDEKNDNSSSEEEEILLSEENNDEGPKAPFDQEENNASKPTQSTPKPPTGSPRKKATRAKSSKKITQETKYIEIKNRRLKLKIHKKLIKF